MNDSATISPDSDSRNCRLWQQRDALQASAAGSTAPLMVSAEECMHRLFEQIVPIAAAPLPVLIMGATGTGKELVARSLWRLGSRRDGPFVPVNCAAIPEALLESEMFGHVEGAFTGAIGTRLGRFAEAHGGILFLDEIAEMCSALQTKLLRVLEDGTYSPVGSNESVTSDVRLICATNQPLLSRVKGGLFRNDLYYRINHFQITIPPLQERREDIIPMAKYFICDFCRTHARNGFVLSTAVEELLLTHDWQGNVRELKTAMDSACWLATSGELKPNHLPHSISRRAVVESKPESWPADLPRQRPKNLELVLAGYILRRHTVDRKEIRSIYQQWKTHKSAVKRHLDKLIDAGLVREIRCAGHWIYEANLDTSPGGLNVDSSPRSPSFSGPSMEGLPLPRAPR